jgi:GWxTD domain-containing protein
VVANVPGTVRSWRRELALAPRTLRAAPLLVADTRVGPGAAPDTLLLADETTTLTLGVGLIRPAAASWPDEGVGVRVEVVADGDRHATLQTRRLDVAPAAADTSWRELDLPTAELPFGRSVLSIVLQWRHDGEDLRLPHQPGLPVVNLRVPFTDDEAWARHVGWLDGVASEARRDSLLATPAPGRQSSWDALWSDVASGADLPAEALSRRHLRRIVAADARFGGFGRGALSDRGRVFVRRGPPDEVETVADGHLPGAVWEIWTYRRPALRFFFHDAHGMGDFRLRRREPLAG